MSAGLVAGGALPRVRGSGAGVRHARRDAHVDPCIRRKLTDAERRHLDELFRHLDHHERLLQKVAARHHESV